MRTSTVEVGELVSTLSAAGVHRQLSTLPGVHHADVNYVAGSATVHYDEAKITLDAIRQRVVDCGYHCRGELAPAHVCDPAGRTTAGHGHSGHAGHALPGGAVRKVGSADSCRCTPVALRVETSSPTSTVLVFMTGRARRALQYAPWQGSQAW